MNRPTFVTLAVVMTLLAGCAGPAAALPRPALPSATPLPATPPPDDAVSNGPGDDGLLPGLPPRSSLDPAPGDERLARGPAYVDSVRMVVLESYPVQVRLLVSGSLPTPCHQLRARVAPPDGQGRIDVEIYSLADPDAACIQVLAPFETSVPLGRVPDGSYSIWVNNQPAGEIRVP